MKSNAKSAFCKVDSSNKEIRLAKDLCVLQPARGFRFSLDSVILARRAARQNALKILDIGTGCGIIPMLIWKLNPKAEIIGIEVQKEIYCIAKKNISKNSMTDRIKILNIDARKVTPADTKGQFDLVLSNPPYTPMGKGRINPIAQQAIARHEIMLNLKELLDAARRMLIIGGKFMAIYPTYRSDELTREMQNAGFRVQHIEKIHTKPGAEPKRVIVTGSKQHEKT